MAVEAPKSEKESRESCTRELYYAAVLGHTTFPTNCHVIFVVHSLYTKPQSSHACLCGFVLTTFTQDYKTENVHPTVTLIPYGIYLVMLHG